MSPPNSGDSAASHDQGGMPSPVEDRKCEDLLMEQQFLREVINANPNFIFVKDRDGKFLLANRALAECYGTDVATLQGRTDMDFNANAEQVSQYLAADRAVMGSHIPRHIPEEPVTCADGRVRWFSTNKIPLVDADGNCNRILGVASDISERKRADELLQAILDTTSEGILVVNEKGRVISANRRFQELWQIPDALMAAADDRALLGHVLAQLSHPVEFLHGVQALYATDDHIQDLLQFQDGRVYERYSRTMRVDGQRCRLWSFRDVSEHQLRAVRLERLNRTLAALGHSNAAQMRTETESDYLFEVCRTLVEECGHALVWIGYAEQDAAHSVRPAAAAGFEWGYLDTLNITWSDGPRGRGPVGSAIRTGQACLCRDMKNDPSFEPWRDEALARGYAASIALPLKVDGQTIAALTIYSRETNPFVDEEVDLLRQLADDLAQGITLLRTRAARDKALAALREADQKRNEFLAIMAHELRNPLAPIRNAVHILKHPDLPQGHVAQSLDMIDRQLQHMVRLIDDLMDISRITSGKLQLSREPVYLDAILEQALEAARPNLDQSGHQLTLELPGEPVRLLADQIRLAQVFLNLLNNACKYTLPGGHIGIEARLEGDHVVVCVRDDGVGLAQENLGHIFDLFTQVFMPSGQGQAGLGIGLSLARSLVEMHEGSIEAHSDGIGQGSEFSIRLPVLEAPATTAAAKQEAVDSNVGIAGQRILVVDDNHDIAESMAMLLRMNGPEVEIAEDGLEAIAAAERFRPDLVLLDIGMPMMDGYEACRHIRDQAWGKHMTLVAMTGWGQEEDKNKAWEAGFDHHLVKPVDPEALLQLLTEQTHGKPRIDHSGR